MNVWRVYRRNPPASHASHLTHSHLTHPQVKGSFFLGTPQLFYGSSLLGFIASFGLTRALAHVMEYEDRKFGHLNLQRLIDHRYACR